MSAPDATAEVDLWGRHAQVSLMLTPGMGHWTLAVGDLSTSLTVISDREEFDAFRLLGEGVSEGQRYGLGAGATVSLKAPLSDGRPRISEGYGPCAQQFEASGPDLQLGDHREGSAGQRLRVADNDHVAEEGDGVDDEAFTAEHDLTVRQRNDLLQREGGRQFPVGFHRRILPMGPAEEAAEAWRAALRAELYAFAALCLAAPTFVLVLATLLGGS